MKYRMNNYISKSKTKEYEATQAGVRGGSASKAMLCVIAMMLALILTFTACAGNAGSTGATSGTGGSAGGSLTTASADTEGYTAEEKEGMFTERDLSGEYSESEAQTITLNGSSAETSAVSGVTISGSTVTITEEGTYILSGTLDDGQIVVDADEAAKVQIVLKNAEITSSTSAALYVRSADKVFVTSAEGTDNVLANGGSFTADGDTNVDGAVFAKDDITFNGSGSLTVDSPAGHGIVGKDDVKICGCDLTVNAANHGIQANDSVRISGASVLISAETKDGIHVSDDADEEQGTESDSFFYMADGSVAISAGDDGIHADAEVLIEGGSIEVTDSYEGIEAMTIMVRGGNINVTASDDGLNAAGGSSSGDTASNTFGDDDWNGGIFNEGGTDGSIEISGGSIYIKAGGDVVDSNGSVTISGGLTVVCGPSQGDTSVLDFNSTGTITGGTFIGTGGAGMAQNFSDASQGVIAVSVGDQSAGQTVTLCDADGNTIAEVTPELDYAAVYISTPDMTQGGTYGLTAGSFSENITLSENIYSNISGGIGGFGREPGQGRMPGGAAGSYADAGSDASAGADADADAGSAV